MKLSKTYVPGDYESDIYALWERSEVFLPKARGSKKTYSIVVPPPNANGNLHIGHALTFALQDIAIRYHRMKGESTLFLPAADHAGFETQVVYEKQLAKEGKSRFDLTREELYKNIWDFVAQNRTSFEEQFRSLGASVDWTRFVFTLDKKIVDRAYATFKKLWDEGLVYRGTRLVNFCTFHGTAFADIEVEHKEVNGRLWHIAYQLVNGEGEITVATTRPETMLGDTAVAVHPEDSRYQHLIGKTVKLPLTEREIPIIADDFVDPEFGTGAVKITPAHDQNDFEAGQRHDLPMITAIDHEGKITHEASARYAGLEAAEARKRIVKDLEEEGRLVKAEEYTHNVGHCYKCGTIIQPLLRDQWFIDMKPLAEPAVKALKEGRITFYPTSKKEQLITYLEGLRDWNISRQIAWGIPIPAFQNVDNPDDWIFNADTDQEFIEVKGKTYRRDSDVFDTWFSSGSWPYATLGYPDSPDYKHFYPLSLMETGGEILYPWVSRMIMLGLYVTGKVPFEAVYVHGYVLAEDGAKMSKSLGNVINPLEVIKDYGSDALRMGIISGRTAAINRGYDPSKVEGARNFCNKLWNIARFITDKVGDEKVRSEKPNLETLTDHWMLTKLHQAAESIGVDIENYRFSEAYDKLYLLVWNAMADWYVEASKAQPGIDMLAYSLDTVLKLAHPFAPFVTETIWQALDWHPEGTLITEPWPEIPTANKKETAAFEDVKTIVSEIRYITTVLKVQKATLYFHDEPFIKKHAGLIKSLARLRDVAEVEAGQGLHLTQTPYTCWLDIDMAAARNYASDLAERKTSLEKIIKQLEARLANKAYVEQAPKHIVEQTKRQLAENRTLLESTAQEYDRFAKF